MPPTHTRARARVHRLYIINAPFPGERAGGCEQRIDPLRPLRRYSQDQLRCGLPAGVLAFTHARVRVRARAPVPPHTSLRWTRSGHHALPRVHGVLAAHVAHARTHLRSGGGSSSSGSNEGAIHTLKARRGFEAQPRREAGPRGWNIRRVGKHEGNRQSALFQPPLWHQVPAAFSAVLTEKPGSSERFRPQVQTAQSADCEPPHAARGPAEGAAERR